MSSRNGKVSENSVQNGSGQDDNEEPMPQQDPEERRKIRRQYREILQETEQKKELLGSYKHVGQLRNILLQGNEIHKSVQHPREAALDSQVLVKISELSVAGARTLPIDFHTFQTEEFAEKLKQMMVDELTQKIPSEGWTNLGRACTCFYKRTPCLKYMLGSFKRDPPQRKEKKQRLVRDLERDRPVVKPKQVDNTSQLGRKEVTTEEVDHVNKVLKKIYREIGTPVCFFEFVVDPKSFGHTIENIFHVAFLIKDGHARIFLDEDGLPVIEPVKRVEEEDRQDDQKKEQVVMTMTEAQWREIIDVFKIQDVILQSREQRERTGGGRAVNGDGDHESESPPKRQKTR